jgi:hypothetical protein
MHTLKNLAQVNQKVMTMVSAPHSFKKEDQSMNNMTQ